MEKTQVCEHIFETFKNDSLEILNSKYRILSTNKICIWGSSVLGRTIYKILGEYDIANNVKCFINSFHKENENILIDDILELSPKEALALYKDATFIIASEFFPAITATAYSLGIPPHQLFYVESGEYGAFFEKLLRFYFFSEKDFANGIDIIGDLRNWFNYFAELKNKGEIEPLINKLNNLFEDDLSKDILNKIIQFYLTGNISFLIDSYCSEEQYFSNSYYRINDNEVFLDCGAYIGDSIERFLKFTNNKFNKIIAVEANKINAKQIENLKVNNLEIKNVAVGDYNGTCSFDSSCLQGGRIGNSSSEMIELNTIDSFSDNNISFIKMDIEGAELAALKGASETIKNQQPKLAICVYHRPKDLFTIPFLIKELNPNYKLKLRKHTRSVYESVIYAHV